MTAAGVGIGVGARVGTATQWGGRGVQGGGGRVDIGLQEDWARRLCGPPGRVYHCTTSVRTVHDQSCKGLQATEHTPQHAEVTSTDAIRIVSPTSLSPILLSRDAQLPCQALSLAWFLHPVVAATKPRTPTGGRHTFSHGCGCGCATDGGGCLLGRLLDGSQQHTRCRQGRCGPGPRPQQASLHIACMQVDSQSSDRTTTVEKSREKRTASD
jgi:hypothetical protein